MATGIVKTQQLSSGAIATLANVYTCPANNYGVYNISFTNTSSASQTIRLYIGASTAASPLATEVFEWQTTIAAYGVFERTALVLAANQNIVAGSSGGSGGAGTATGYVAVNVYGIETSTV
jgi:hypothetical protein